eukprot:scaffold196636_cov13-Tisochrysis_lutea.AAC.1
MHGQHNSQPTMQWHAFPNKAMGYTENMALARNNTSAISMNDPKHPSLATGLLNNFRHRCPQAHAIQHTWSHS